MLLWILTHIPDFIIYALIGVGVIGYFFGNLLPVPQLGKLSPQTGGVAIFGIGLFLLGLTMGAGVLQSEIDAANAEIKRINERSVLITEKVVVKYVTEQKQVKDRGEQIAKYINTNNDKVCTIYNSTVELLNSAAQNKLPDPTRAVDDTPTRSGNNIRRSSVTK